MDPLLPQDDHSDSAHHPTNDWHLSSSSFFLLQFDFPIHTLCTPMVESTRKNDNQGKLNKKIPTLILQIFVIVLIIKGQ